MGIKDLRPHLVVSLVNWKTYKPDRRRRIDAANLLYHCLWMHAAEALEGNYDLALASFKTYLESFASTKTNNVPMKYILVFDGKRNEYKCYEVSEEESTQCGTLDTGCIKSVMGRAQAEK